jgi:hypothetical protein
MADGIAHERYSKHDQPSPESRPVITALLLEPA